MMTKNRFTAARIATFQVFCLIILLTALSCNKRMPELDELNQDAVLNPDYTSITVPANIAPLNFTVKENADKYLARFYNSDGIDFIVTSENGSITIPEKKWHRLL